MNIPNKSGAAKGITPAPKPAPVKVEPPVPPAFVWNGAVVKARLQNVQDYYTQFIGKPGYNPFFYIARVINPLWNRLEQGEESQSLHDEAMALECSEPTAAFNARLQ